MSAFVADRARHVQVVAGSVGGYAAALSRDPPSADAAPGDAAETEQRAAFELTLDAINFGSGWFPTLRKRAEPTGYRTIAAGVRRRFDAAGAWSAAELQAIGAAELAALFDQDPDHELMALFVASLHDLGRHVADEFGGSFLDVVGSARGSAVALVELLATWDCFADSSPYDGLTVPFLKRAQIGAADLARARVASFADLGELTMFADNLVPHVLRLDGVLAFEPELVARIERGELIEHGSPEEVEIRACAIHAVELIVTAAPVPTTAADVDQLLWSRGQQPHYKAHPRHRSRCTAY
jgi:hypothetical protein